MVWIEESLGAMGSPFPANVLSKTMYRLNFGGVPGRSDAGSGLPRIRGNPTTRTFANGIPFADPRPTFPSRSPEVRGAASHLSRKDSFAPHVVRLDSTARPPAPRSTGAPGIRRRGIAVVPQGSDGPRVGRGRPRRTRSRSPAASASGSVPAAQPPFHRCPRSSMTETVDRFHADPHVERTFNTTPWQTPCATPGRPPDWGGERREGDGLS